MSCRAGGAHAAWAGGALRRDVPDWLLIYETTDAEVVLARTGTHTDVFHK